MQPINSPSGGTASVSRGRESVPLHQPHMRIDQQYHFHVSDRPTSSVKNMDRTPKSIVCNSGGIVVAEMVYRCLMCRTIFETPLDCRTHFRCFHGEHYGFKNLNAQHKWRNNTNKTTMHAALTVDRLNDHYKHCIRLNASNKINAKNAFVLQLIDYMHDLVNQADDGQMNFKIASSALDVGAKIYSHRVDCVHSEAQKVASSILMALDPHQQKHSNNSNLDQSHGGDDSGAANNDTLNESNEGEDGPSKAKKRRTAARKNIKTIVDDTNSLNGKIEKIVIGDAYLDGLSQEYDMSCPAALICYNPKTQPGGVLSIDSNHRSIDYCRSTQTLASAPSTSSDSTIQDQATLVPLITKYANCAQIIKENKLNRICPRLDKFLFKDRSTTIQGFNPSADNDEARAFPVIDSETTNQNDLENAEHRFQPDLYNDNDCGDDFPMDDDYGNDPDVTQIVDPEAENNAEDLLNNLKKIGVARPTEYGYTSEPRLYNTWAGPHAWRVAKIPTDKKDGLSKSVRKRQKLEQKPINFQENPSSKKEHIADKELRHSSESLRKWKKPLLPQDHNLNSDSCRNILTHAFERPEHIYLSLEAIKEDHNYIKRSDSVMDNTMPASPPMAFEDYHDDSDDEFHADPMVNGNEVAIFGAALNNTLTQNADFEFAGDNLIDMPFSVAQIHIPYAKVAKKMDVRRLKRVMWDMLSPPVNRLDNTMMNATVMGNQTPVETEKTITNESDDGTTKDGQKELSISSESSVKLQFSNLYGDLPQKVNPRMARDLSQPIAFVTLLHLANEKNLKLIPTEDLKDFIIETYIFPEDQ